MPLSITSQDYLFKGSLANHKNHFIYIQHLLISHCSGRNTPMLAEIESLLVLQDRDQRILSIEADLKRIPLDKERAKERLANDLAAVANAKKAIQENEMAIKTVELDIGTRKDTLAKLKVQQYETKKNEEFTALGNEIIRYNDDIDSLETTELELMEKADALQKTLKEKEKALALTQSMVDKEIANLDQSAAECTKQYTEVKANRDELASHIDEDLLALYQRLLKSKKGRAVVAINHGQCGGCHMKLVPATIINVNADKEVTQCENCGCILHA